MLKTIKENVIKPSLTRLGFLLTGWLTAQGVHGDYANMVATGCIGAGLIMFDLLFAYLRKRKIINDAYFLGLLDGKGPYEPKPKSY